MLNTPLECEELLYKIETFLLVYSKNGSTVSPFYYLISFPFFCQKTLAYFFRLNLATSASSINLSDLNDVSFLKKNQTGNVENASVCTCEDELHCIIYGRKVAEQLYFDAASLPY